jgi:hypothetical protein
MMCHLSLLVERRRSHFRRRSYFEPASVNLLFSALHTIVFFPRRFVKHSDVSEFAREIDGQDGSWKTMR